MLVMTKRRRKAVQVAIDRRKRRHVVRRRSDIGRDRLTQRSAHQFRQERFGVAIARHVGASREEAESCRQRRFRFLQASHQLRRQDCAGGGAEYRHISGRRSFSAARDRRQPHHPRRRGRGAPARAGRAPPQRSCRSAPRRDVLCLRTGIDHEAAAMQVQQNAFRAHAIGRLVDDHGHARDRAALHR